MFMLYSIWPGSLLVLGLVVGSFDEFAFLESCACPDQGDKVRRFARAPSGLRGLDEL
jgi:hypothetical protein